MQIAIPEILMENGDMWYFDGWKAIPKLNASDEIVKACQSLVDFVKQNITNDTGLIQE